MKFKWNGIDWPNGDYFYWVDPVIDPGIRTVGLLRLKFSDRVHNFICLWFFDISWSFTDATKT